jgi:sterol desaturase/sphingolipid hydroxylase (fatty acid hydroxylase superfamily)
MSVPLIVLISAILMMGIEFFSPGRVFPRTQYWWSRACVFNSLQAATSFMGAITWDLWLPQLQLFNSVNLSFWLQVLMGYLLITFVYYWWHRLRHEVPLLWRWLHQLHHSPARIEIITSFYKHPLELLTNGILSSIILYCVLGLSPNAVVTVILITGLAELFYHWNIKTPYTLGFFFQRPESHCLHHKKGSHRFNYSDLPLWDMMFGTFHNPISNTGSCGFSGLKETKLLAMLCGKNMNKKETL